MLVSFLPPSHHFPTGCFTLSRLRQIAARRNKEQPTVCLRQAGLPDSNTVPMRVLHSSSTHQLIGIPKDAGPLADKSYPQADICINN